MTDFKACCFKYFTLTRELFRHHLGFIPACLEILYFVAKNKNKVDQDRTVSNDYVETFLKKREQTHATVAIKKGEIYFWNRPP